MEGEEEVRWGSAATTCREQTQHQILDFSLIVLCFSLSMFNLECNELVQTTFVVTQDYVACVLYSTVVSVSLHWILL